MVCHTVAKRLAPDRTALGAAAVGARDRRFADTRILGRSGGGGRGRRRRVVQSDRQSRMELRRVQLRCVQLRCVQLRRVQLRRVQPRRTRLRSVQLQRMERLK